MTAGAILGLLASAPVLHGLGSRRSLTGALLLIAAAMTALGLALMLGSVPLVAAAFVIIGLGIGLLDVLINVEGSAVERAAGRTLMPMMHAAWSCQDHQPGELTAPRTRACIKLGRLRGLGRRPPRQVRSTAATARLRRVARSRSAATLRGCGRAVRGMMGGDSGGSVR